MTDFDEMHTEFEEDDFLFCDKELHHYHHTQLEQNEGLYQHFSATKGFSS